VQLEGQTTEVSMTANIELQIQNLEQTNPLRERTLRSAIEALHPAPGSRGLDIGCGIGLQTLLLAEATNPDGIITGLDISPELLANAREKIKDSTFANRISFQEGSMDCLPFEDESFDWVWSADCVGYPAGDTLPVLKEIARVLRPGGTLAILAWTSQQLIPGYPLLEARLNATCSAYTPFLQGKPPQTHFMRCLRWFPEARIANPLCRTFVGEVQGPVKPEIRNALILLFEMLWSTAESEADRLEFKRLCRPESPDFNLRLSSPPTGPGPQAKAILLPWPHMTILLLWMARVPCHPCSMISANSRIGISGS
jgi:demethylmenaquinone methyltransferase/2-methoxy-6-polyprenyl-1,4-benzoquinol methylase